MADEKRCIFCTRPENEVKTLVGNEGGPYICNKCVGACNGALEQTDRAQDKKQGRPLPKPKEIKAFLDEHVISQDSAKTDIAVAVYNHYKRWRRKATNYEGVEIQKSNILIPGPSGCHRRGQKVLMYDGSLKTVEDVRVGDQLMGPDSTPRRVLELHHGTEAMVQIRPTKGEPWVVNEGHILTLVQTGTKTGSGYKKLNKVKDVPLRDWFQWSRTQKAQHKLFRVAVDFPSSDTLPLDAYFLGVLLGDGSFSSGTPRVTTQDPEVVEEIEAQARKFGLRVAHHESRSRDGACPIYGLSGPHGGSATPNPIALALAGLDLWGVPCESKFIPQPYLTASQEDRLSLLAGLLDADGSLNCNGYDFVSKSKALADDLTFLARSLGFAAYPSPCVKRSQNGTEATYYRVFVSGHTDRIPVRIDAKKAAPRQQVKDVLRVGFTTEPLPPEEYFGFVLDGDHRYLLDDFTVTHNTGKTEIARTIAKLLDVPFYVADATKMTQAGYVGDDVESMLQGLISDAGGDVERAERGIIVIDEIDKLARKSGRNASGYRDVTGEGVQQSLLKIVEGSKVTVPRGMQKLISSAGQDHDVVDTSEILFVCMGSFAGIEEVVKRRVNKSAAIGFGTNNQRRDLNDTEVYRELIEEDILEFGIIPELAGRLPVIACTLPLTEDEMVRILVEPKNAILKQFQALFALDGIDLQFDEAACKAVGREAQKRPTGARALRSIMENVLKPYGFELPSDDTVKALRITEEVVEEGIDALIVREAKKAAAEA